MKRPGELKFSAAAERFANRSLLQQQTTTSKTAEKFNSDNLYEAYSAIGDWACVLYVRLMNSRDERIVASERRAEGINPDENDLQFAVRRLHDLSN